MPKKKIDNKDETKKISKKKSGNKIDIFIETPPKENSLLETILEEHEIEHVSEESVEEEPNIQQIVESISEPVVESISEPIVEISHVEPVVEISPVKPIVEISPVEPVVEIASVEPVVEISPAEPIVETSSLEPVVEISPVEPVVEISPVEPVVEISPVEPVVEIVSVEPVVEIVSVEPVVEIVSVEPVVEISPVEPVVEISPVENVPLKPTLQSIFEKINKYLPYINLELESDKYILDKNQINNILHGIINEEQISNINNKYLLDDLKNLFNKFNNSIMLIQIIDGKIKYIEKKGYESRNQSVIDLLLKSNKYKKLPNVQFLIFTNDFIDDINLCKFPYLLTFCKNIFYNTSLFPNFNFNNWLEAGIGNYEDIYSNFIKNNVEWDNKENTIFWSGSNTNILRKKLYDYTKKISNKEINFNINLIDKDKKNYLPLEEILKYKYLLNINGYSYAGRLNYLYLSGSCIIILKNKDENKSYDEFFYNYFIKNEDYIEILYNDSDRIENIINKIYNAINNNNCKEIAERCLNKAKIFFKMNNIYEYINLLLTKLSLMNNINKYLDNSLFYTPSLNYFYNNRLNIINNEVNFYFKGGDLEINLINSENNIININIINNITTIKYNDNEILQKYTPFIVTEKKNQLYKILIEQNNINIIMENKFNLIKLIIPNENFMIENTDIKTKYGGMWLLS